MNLYHYTTVHGLLGILNSNEFWISKSTFMNDPGEIEYAWDIYKKEILKYEKKVLFSTLIKWIDGTLKVQDFFILSLSKEKDSLYLWTIYGKRFGYLIEIDLESLINEIKNSSVKGVFKGFFHVSYEEDFINKYVKTLIKEYSEAQTINRNFPIDSEKTADLNFKVLSSLFSFKHKAYSDEKEVRGIFIIPNLKSLVTESIWYDNITFRSQENRILPFITLKMQNRKWIKNIYLGPLNKDLRYKEGIELLLKSKKISINVLQSKAPYRE